MKDTKLDLKDVMIGALQDSVELLSNRCSHLSEMNSFMYEKYVDLEEKYLNSFNQ